MSEYIVKNGDLIDPPNGWLYGFPKPYDSSLGSIEQFCLKSGYPESKKDLLKHISVSFVEK